jgi:hypothetical protein
MNTNDQIKGWRVRRYDSMGFADEFGMWVRWVDHDAMAKRLAACETFIADYVAAEDRAVAQWNADFPKLPWKPDHDAMKRLEAARAIASSADNR